MEVSLERINDEYLFKGTGGSEVPVYIDNKTDVSPKGASPMELLLMGIGGCSAIDVIMILKKQRQTITHYGVEVRGDRKEVKGAKPFEAMHVAIHLEGEIDPAKALRAAKLSFEKYCSVSITLEKSVAITYDLTLNGTVIS
ncbi:OsmC family protein [Altibacter sp. HG106]|uniref:OsmC family protein n=1 Tax=Altibacter sp. HG106 TaxID=3023937 RepID=UPI002350E0EA|nr:OsmC family protein [Altibacter sp. HG106]MDC7994386.1 OsmC family protein [Altibacter sp. HG106]